MLLLLLVLRTSQHPEIKGSPLAAFFCENFLALKGVPFPRKFCGLLLLLCIC